MTRRRLALVAVAGLFAAPYLVGAGWGRYLAADAGILAAAFWGLGRGAPGALGLRIPPRHLAVAAGLGLVVAAGALAATSALEAAGRVEIWRAADPRRHVFSASQALHQEMVLRALLLGAVRRRLGSDLAASLLVAGGFVALHAGFYTGVVGVALPATTLATLLAFALAGNELYLAYGHVGFSLALHAGWNVVRFPALYRALPSERPLTQAESFAVVEGTPELLAAALLLLVACAAATRLRGAAPRARPEA